MSDLSQPRMVILLAPLLCCGVARGQPEPKEYATIDLGKESVAKVVFSPTGDSLAYMFSGKTIAIWDVKAKEQRKRVHKAEIIFLDMDYSPDGKALIISEVSKVFRLDAETGERTFLYQHLDGKDGHPDVRRLRYSPDGKRVISADRTINVWDVDKKEKVATIDCKGYVSDLVCVPGTDQVVVHLETSAPKPNDPKVTVLSNAVAVVDLKTREVRTITDPAPPVMYQQSAASPDGKLVALPFGVEIQWLSTSSWKGPTIAVPKSPVDPNACLFSESGRVLIAGGSTKDVHSLRGPPGEVAILDVANNKWVGHFRVLDREVTSMALSPKSDLLAVASSKTGSITLWDLSPVIASLPRDKTGRAPEGKGR